jgi:KDO2-lipid IV(A) lauroyltransferase
MKKAFHLTQAAVFYLFTLAAALLPACSADATGALVGRLMFYLIPGRRAVAADNIRQALPAMTAHRLWTDNESRDPDTLVRETFTNIGRSLVEVCRLYHGRGESLINGIEVRGREHYDAARAKGKGLIFFTGHCGNWELVALAYSRIFNDAMSVVARKQNNEYLNRMVERMRMRYNNSVIYKQGALRPILSTLKKKGVVGILADQAVFPEEGVLVEVLGRRAWASKAPVIIAQKSGAPLVPAFIHREGGRHVITMLPEHQFSGDMSDEGIARETQALSRYVEDFIVAHPTQWYWVHRRWKRAGERVLL